MAETKEFIRGNKYVVERGGTLLHFQQNVFSDSKSNWKQDGKRLSKWRKSLRSMRK